MIFSNTLGNISIVEKDLFLTSKSSIQTKIPISDLDKIYFSCKKIAPIYHILFLLVSMAIVLLSFWYVFANIIVVILSTIMIFYGSVKMNAYKGYRLILYLKNGDCIRKNVSYDLKYNTIDMVNKIRKMIYYAKIENDELERISPIAIINLWEQPSGSLRKSVS